MKTVLYLKLGLILLLLIAVRPLMAQVTFEEWEKSELSENEVTHRHENAFIEVNGKFYLLGGRGNKNVNVYDPISQTWTSGSTPPIQLHHFQAVSFDSKIYVIGAFTGGFPSETPVPNIYIYDPGSDTWTEGPLIPEDRRRGAAGAAVYNNKIYVVSGITNGHLSGHVQWFDEFDPVTGNWKVLPDIPHARDHFQVAVSGNKLVAAGGRRSQHDDQGGGFKYTVPEVDVYDFSLEEWGTLSADIPTPRAGTTSIAVGDEILVIGGEGPNQEAINVAHRETEILNLVNTTWRPGPLLNTGRHATQAIVFNNKVYIACGSSQRGGNAVTEKQAHSLEVMRFSGIVGPVKESLMNQVKVGPNPVVNRLTVGDLEGDFKVEIFKSNGSFVGKYNFYRKGELDVSGLEKGVYFVKILNINGDYSNCYKIVKL